MPHGPSAEIEDVEVRVRCIAGESRIQDERSTQDRIPGGGLVDVTAECDLGPEPGETEFAELVVAKIYPKAGPSSRSARWRRVDEPYVVNPADRERLTPRQTTQRGANKPELSAIEQGAAGPKRT